jgi:hypothetical protein
MSAQHLSLTDLAAPAPKAQTYTSGSKVGPLSTPAVALQEKQKAQLSQIRRLSDPRLTNKLLGTMDPEVTGAASSRSPVARTPAPTTPKTGTSATPRGQMSARAKKIHESLQPVSNEASDRLLFSAVKARPGVKEQKYDPALVAAVRGEDYAQLLKKNKAAYDRLTDTNKQTFALAERMGDALARKIGERNRAAGAIDEAVGVIAADMEDERKKWVKALKEMTV